MKERGILFSGPMVQTILAGHKTQTRRVVKTQPKCDRVRSFSPHDWKEDMACGQRLMHECKGGGRDGCFVSCPYGHPGDRLWVRETFQHFGNSYDAAGAFCNVQYRADNAVAAIPWTHMTIDAPPTRKWWNSGREPWTPPIHMPRWASRITLEITDVRVQRVQEISEEDAICEGVSLGSPDGEPTQTLIDGYRGHFRWLWNSINEARGYSWESDPWVWAITFKQKARG